jgi:hypothetical protein
MSKQIFTSRIVEPSQFLTHCLEVINNYGLHEHVLYGALSTMFTLETEHRTTKDIDLICDDPEAVIKKLPNNPKVIKDANLVKIALDNTGLCLIKVPESRTYLPDNFHDRMALLSFSWARQSAKDADLSVYDYERDTDISCRIKMVTPGALLAIKAYEMMERRGANVDDAGVDAFDIVLLVSDPIRRRQIAQELDSAPYDLRDLIIKSIQENFVDSSVSTSAILRLNERTRHKLPPSYLEIVAQGLISELTA